MSLKENTLWNAGVGNAGLQNVNGVVLKVIVHSAFAETVVLIWILNNSFLEVDGEVKYLN